MRGNEMRKWLAVLLVLFPALLMAAPEKEILLDLEGRPHALDEYAGRGKWLVVMVWASVRGVQPEVHETIAHQAHRETDAAVLGISVDGPGGKRTRWHSSNGTGKLSQSIDDGKAFKALPARHRPSWFWGRP